MIVDSHQPFPYEADFKRDEGYIPDYSQAVTSVEFSKFKTRADDPGSQSGSASLMATSHVDGSLKVYKFGSFDELSQKHRECRPDIQFKDHFYSANQVAFAQNTRDVNGRPLD